MSELLLPHRETECGVGGIPSFNGACKSLALAIDFSAEIQFSSDLQCKAHLTWDHWSQAGLLLTLEKVVCISSWLGDQRQLRH